MSQDQRYPIGTPGQKWSESEKAAWFAEQSIKRSYQAEVIDKLQLLSDQFAISQYGALSYDKERYPLFIAKSINWDASKPVALITGGVHGYETSGVQGTLRFLQTQAKVYEADFNLVVAPCVSPWGYETINRWNPKAIDPNRSFVKGHACEETQNLMQAIAGLAIKPVLHIDLHETTDTDNSEFGPALAARDGVDYQEWEIPDGFYLVGDCENPVDAFQKAVIDEVSKVTHIAAADKQNCIIGEPIAQKGVINYAVDQLGLCTSITRAAYKTTTEVYPDSPNPAVDDENCIQAQVAAVVGALAFVQKL